MEMRKTSLQLVVWLSCLMALMIVLGYCVPASVAEGEATPGEAEECQHENAVVTTEERTTYYELDPDYPEEIHIRHFDTYKVTTCPDCGYVSETMDGFGHVPEEHDGDPCSLCGWKNPCPHENMETYTYENGVSVSDNGDGTHTVIYNEVRQQHCLDCNMWMKEEVLSSDLTKTQKHEWDNAGICWICGAENPCTHEHTATSTYMGNESISDNGDGTHTVTYDLYQDTWCEDCGMWMGNELLASAQTQTESHHWQSNGFCWDCGAENTCTHQRVVEIDGWRDEDAVFKDNGDGRTHTITAMTTIDRVCGDCDTWLSEEETGVKTWSETHEYDADGSTCVYCGYVNTCSHPTMVDEDIWHSVKWTDNGDGKTHTASYELWTVKVCPTCGWMNWDTETFVKNATTVEEHLFRNGQCNECLAEEPAATATPAPTKTPAPAQTSAPSGSSSSSGGTTTVKQPEADIEFIATPEPVATAAPEMVSTLLDTIAQAQAEGSEVSVEVVGAKEVFTETEYAQLKTLPAQEQMLVTLASIGLQDVVESALASMDVTLSAEAEALTAQVAERFAAMDEEERAQVEEKLTQLFPKTQVTVNGVTYEYFVVDLQITVDGKVRVERYGFRYDEALGQWVFEKLDLVDMYVEAA